VSVDVATRAKCEFFRNYCAVCGAIDDLTPGRTGVGALVHPRSRRFVVAVVIVFGGNLLAQRADVGCIWIVRVVRHFDWIQFAVTDRRPALAVVGALLEFGVHPASEHRVVVARMACQHGACTGVCASIEHQARANLSPGFSTVGRGVHTACVRLCTGSDCGEDGVFVSWVHVDVTAALRVFTLVGEILVQHEPAFIAGVSAEHPRLSRGEIHTTAPLGRGVYLSCFHTGVRIRGYPVTVVRHPGVLVKPREL